MSFFGTLSFFRFLAVDIDHQNFTAHATLSRMLRAWCSLRQRVRSTRVGCTRLAVQYLSSVPADRAGAEAGYQGFGSFHVEHSVEDMIRMSDTEFESLVPDTYRSLSFPKGFVGNDFTSDNSFGKAARDSLFGLDPTCTFLNHGAFGAPIAPGLQAAAEWRRKAEQQPLEFMDRIVLPELVRTTRIVARSVLKSAAADTALVSNATTGLNAVLASLQRHALLDGHVMLLDIGYGADKAMARHFTSTPRTTNARSSEGPRVVEVPIVSGLTDSNTEYVVSQDGKDCSSFDRYILQQVESAILTGPPLSLAIFDHVTSNTALKLPIRALTRLCHDHGIPVLVDGAHSVGLLPDFSLDQSQDNLPDFFVGNFHKWFLAPRGSGFLWCNPRGSSQHGISWTDIVRHPIVSHGDESGFHSSFSWFGNTDYSPLLALRAVAEGVWQTQLCQEEDGISPQSKAIFEYTHRLCIQAAELLARAWDVDGGCVSSSS